MRPGGCCERTSRCFGCTEDCASAGSFVLAALTGLCFVLCVIGVALVASDEHTEAQEGNDDGGDDESPLVHFLLIWVVMKGLVWASNLVVAAVMTTWLMQLSPGVRRWLP